MASSSPKTPHKKPKLVRDSFTIPKTEFAAIDTLKTRAMSMGTSVKKSELLRAGLMLLTSLTDSGFKAAIAAVPTLKTGRPAALEKSASAKPAAAAPKTASKTSDKPGAGAKKPVKSAASKPSPAKSESKPATKPVVKPVEKPTAAKTTAKKVPAPKVAAKASPAPAAKPSA